MEIIKAQEIEKKRFWKIHNEGLKHIMLKDLAIFWLKELGAKRVETEVLTRLGHFVDVVGYFPEGKTVAIECGDISEKNMLEFQELFTVIVHLPYCYTPEITFSKDAVVENIEDKLIGNQEGDS